MGPYFELRTSIVEGHLGVCSARKPPVVAIVTGGVLQAEAGLVALGHRSLGAGVQ